MRTILFIISYLILIQIAHAQPTAKAILERNKFGYSKDDTIGIFGYYPADSNHPNKYVTKAKNGNIRLVNPSHIKIIDTISNFWDNQWFLYRSGEVYQKGTNSNIRNILKGESKAFYKDMKDNEFLLKDSALLDYLNQMALFIGPKNLFKGYETQLKVYVIKSDKSEIFSFDDGSIYLTTAQLANTSSEEELIKLLSTEISHIMFDDQYLGLRAKRRASAFTAIFIGVVAVATIVAVAANSSSDNSDGNNHHHSDESSGVFVESVINYVPTKNPFTPPSQYLQYNSSQMRRVNLAVKSFNEKELNKIDLLSNSEYIQTISPSITCTAWELFFDEKYKEALAMVNKQETYGSCSSDDYLLKAKLYRKLFKTDEANYEALEYIQKAKNLASQTNIDIIKEEGLIYYQLNQMEKARASFEEYKYGLKQTGINSDDDKRELKWVDSMIYKTQNK